MSDVYIREGTTRSGFSMMYHEIFDLYHPYIGDKATLIYLYLLRSRNNEKGSVNHGKSWRGRAGLVEKFQFSYSTLPLIDGILEAAGLISIETKPSGRGRDKIYYVVNDPVESSQFERYERTLIENLTAYIISNPKAAKLIGKEHAAKLTRE